MANRSPFTRGAKVTAYLRDSGGTNLLRLASSACVKFLSIIFPSSHSENVSIRK